MESHLPESRWLFFISAGLNHFHYLVQIHIWPGNLVLSLHVKFISVFKSFANKLNQFPLRFSLDERPFSF
jgi:hypothetical protein